MDCEFSKHARDLLSERGIEENFVWGAMGEPDWRETREDGNEHYFKTIMENDGRVLHVVVNHRRNPKRIVTLFYDRKARRKP
jgi:hypothetical protein